MQISVNPYMINSFLLFYSVNRSRDLRCNNFYAAHGVVRACVINYLYVSDSGGGI